MFEIARNLIGRSTAVFQHSITQFYVDENRLTESDVLLEMKVGHGYETAKNKLINMYKQKRKGPKRVNDKTEN